MPSYIWLKNRTIIYTSFLEIYTLCFKTKWSMGDVVVLQELKPLQFFKLKWSARIILVSTSHIGNGYLSYEDDVRNITLLCR